jgi:hypothetical protein
VAVLEATELATSYCVMKTLLETFAQMDLTMTKTVQLTVLTLTAMVMLTV